MGVWRARWGASKFLQAGLNPYALALEIKDGKTFSAMQRQSRSHTRPWFIAETEIHSYRQCWASSQPKPNDR
jgi:hypothetical protein